MNPNEFGDSVVRFYVDQSNDLDEDSDTEIDAVVPFQIAYAVSIHKAQGLEYESVKVVITEDIDEMITHNIFYTAITRARSKLKIYWSLESQQRVVSRFEGMAARNDANIFAGHSGQHGFNLGARGNHTPVSLPIQNRMHIPGTEASDRGVSLSILE